MRLDTLLGLSLLVGLCACAPLRGAGTRAADDAPGAARVTPPVRPLGETPAGCPDLSGPGLKSFRSAGYDREALVLMPPGPGPDLPVVFVWHGLGATARSMVPRLGLRELAAAGAVVVVPTAHPKAELGWGFSPGGVEDLAVFDDLRACLHQALSIDLARVSSMGFSAGGLWTTFLLFHRADALASAVAMSGGVFPPIMTYETPASPLPVLLFDGGPRNIYRKGPVTVHFDRNTAKLRDRLREDGTLVVHCPHDRGHSVPSWRAELIHRWVLAHRVGEPSPFAVRDAPPGCTAR